VLLSAIGDVVHGLPVAASLRDAWPEARIDWVVQPTALPLVRPTPDVDEFLVFRRDRGLRGFLEFRDRVRDRSWDLVLDLQVYFKAGLLTWMMDAPVKMGFDRARAFDLNWLFTTHRIPPHPVQHVQDQYFEFLDHLGIPVVRRWDFAFDEEERRTRDAFFAEVGRPALAVVLGSTRAGKDWIPERYARVLDIAASRYGLRPVIVGSEAPGERKMAERVRALTDVDVVDARRNDLRRLAWILDGADLALSPDTGPLHVAAALGTPVVGLYGYTDPKRTGPYPEAYRELVVDNFSRSGETEPVHEFRAGNMERIEVEDVLEKLDRAVQRYL
jgi:heptosyltransferase I